MGGLCIRLRALYTKVKHRVKKGSQFSILKSPLSVRNWPSHLHSYDSACNAMELLHIHPSMVAIGLVTGLHAVLPSLVHLFLPLYLHAVLPANLAFLCLALKSPQKSCGFCSNSNATGLCQREGQWEIWHQKIKGLPLFNRPRLDDIYAIATLYVMPADYQLLLPIIARPEYFIGELVCACVCMHGGNSKYSMVGHLS